MQHFTNETGERLESQNLRLSAAPISDEACCIVCRPPGECSKLLPRTVVSHSCCPRNSTSYSVHAHMIKLLPALPCTAEKSKSTASWLLCCVLRRDVAVRPVFSFVWKTRSPPPRSQAPVVHIKRFLYLTAGGSALQACIARQIITNHGGGI